MADRQSGRSPVEAVLDWIDAQVSPLGAEIAAVADAAGRVLAEPVAATADIPPFDRAVIDGIAVSAEATLGASSYNPLPLVAVRVDAGERLPGGADAVIPLDHVSLDAGGTCEIIEPVAPGSGIERAGGHAGCGAALLPAGQRLLPHDIGLLALAGMRCVRVVRRPVIRILIAGGGIISPDVPPSPDTVYDADGPLLRALVERDGGIATDLRTVERDRSALRDALAAPGADLILVAGGTGSGSDDFAASALAAAGELAIHRVALQPGESAGIGRVGTATPVFLLPGAPASCLWAYEFFAGRAIRRLAGRNPALPFRSREMRTSRKIVSAIGMMEICPVRCGDDGRAEPIAPFSERGLVAAAGADGFIIVPEGSEGFAEGAPVTVHLYEARP